MSRRHLYNSCFCFSNRRKHCCPDLTFFYPFVFTTCLFFCFCVTFTGKSWSCNRPDGRTSLYFNLFSLSLICSLESRRIGEHLRVLMFSPICSLVWFLFLCPGPSLDLDVESSSPSLAVRVVWHRSHWGEIFLTFKLQINRLVLLAIFYWIHTSSTKYRDTNAIFPFFLQVLSLILPDHDAKYFYYIWSEVYLSNCTRVLYLTTTVCHSLIGLACQWIINDLREAWACLNVQAGVFLVGNNYASWWLLAFLISERA